MNFVAWNEFLAMSVAKAMSFLMEWLAYWRFGPLPDWKPENFGGQQRQNPVNSELPTVGPPYVVTVVTL